MLESEDGSEEIADVAKTAKGLGSLKKEGLGMLWRADGLKFAPVDGEGDGGERQSAEGGRDGGHRFEDGW